MADHPHTGHRERMKKKYMNDGNFDNFHDHEVLEILLYYCYTRKNTNEIAHRLINEFGSFFNLVSTHPKEISKRCSISENVAVLVSMVPHLSKLYLKGSLGDKIEMSNSKMVGKYCVNLFANANYEHFYVLCLNNQRQLLRAELLHKGTINSATVYPRIVMESALKNKASNIILTHNHPGGSVSPSKDDIDTTRNLKAALKTVDIEVLDHIIVAGDKYYSFIEKKLVF